MSRTVLVVDDEMLLLDSTAWMLEELGYDPIPALHATEALGELTDNEEIDLLITDVHMPGMSGCELAEAAKKQRPGLSVLFISGRQTSGIYPILHKPFSCEDLCRELEKFAG